MKEINHAHDGHSINHGNHTEKKVFTKAKLTALGNIIPNTDIPLTINIQDSTDKAIERFDIFQ